MGTSRNKTEYGKSKRAGGGTLYEVLHVGKMSHQLASNLSENQFGKGVLTSYTIHSVNREDQLLRENTTIPLTKERRKFPTGPS